MSVVLHEEIVLRVLKCYLSILLTVGLIFLLGFRHGILPRMGPFLNPFTGFWQNNRAMDRVPSNLKLKGLEDRVQVVYDERHVPHVFADNAHDLYFAQGYLTARDRLWQMEIMTMNAAGRLSEIIGPSMLESDRFFRRIGMVTSAEANRDAMLSDSETALAAEAYVEGVNAFIKTLNRSTLPLEYKLLDYRPEPWTVLKSALLFMYMAWDLTGYNDEVAMTRSLEALGEKELDGLYPYHPPFLEPIIPKGTSWPFRPELPRKPSKSFVPERNELFAHEPTRYRVGSNNWAISGERTKSGYPILCGDPHLGLNLPSIWYEIQLVSEDVNVYGVSLPGSPSVIIGFNEDVAWSMTNAGSDVLDWYAVTFRDTSYGMYFYDGAWRETTRRLEDIHIRGGQAVVDTVILTHHGPVVNIQREKSFGRRVPVDASMRWVAHRPSNILKALLKLNRAASYEDYREALVDFNYPAQNIVFACRNGDIAIQHNGTFPLRWKGQGRTLSDGSDPAYEWQGWIPYDHLPTVLNPKQGFVSSANQAAVDATYPYYLGWDYSSFPRSRRINETLSSMNEILPEFMIDFQQDHMSLRARTVLPVIMQDAAGWDLSEEETEALDLLKDWDYCYQAESAVPTVFDAWWRALYGAIWADEISRPDGSLRWPREDVTVDLILNQPRSRYFDDGSTSEIEILDDLLVPSFKDALENVTDRLGPMSDAWLWKNARGTDIMHLARIPALSRMGLPTDGSGGIVNATSRTSGPSWRMVVELGPEVQAWGVYPGGQSGNPGSRFYDQMVDDWVEGDVYPLPFLKSLEDVEERYEIMEMRDSR